jgi:hypothetical protein
LTLRRSEARAAAEKEPWADGQRRDELPLGRRKLAAEPQIAGTLAIAMLARGTRQLSRQQIADEITRLKVQGRLTHFETTRDKLPEALELAAQILSEPSFPASRVRGTSARVC